MASKQYHTITATGDRLLVTRAIKQGAPTKPDALKHTKRIIVNMTQAEYDRFVASNVIGFSDSAFANLLVFTGLAHLSASD